MSNDPRAAVPSIALLLGDLEVSDATRGIGREESAELLREVVEDLRAAILTRANIDTSDIGRLREQLLDEARGRIVLAAAIARGGVSRRVINATGVVLHTNLGRSPLGEDARGAIADVAAGYSATEIDLESGRRGRRGEGLERLLRLATGAEAALVVNNNAAAVLLVVSAFARGGEVIVNRGELVEIGGSFRIPDVMGWGGARLREVGTTNRTHLSDYEATIGPETAAIMVVHPSNYRISGFTRCPELPELAALARKNDILLIEDQGSGYIVDPREIGLPERRSVRQSLEAGAHLVTFSGDKILGGPQAGVLVGDTKRIDALRGDPLARAIRIDRFTIAALEATLRSYVEERWRDLPVPRMLASTPIELASRAHALSARIVDRLGGDTREQVDTIEGDSRVGGGAFPEAPLPTTLVRIRPVGIATHKLAQSMRLRPLPIIARVSDDAVLLDPRTIARSEEGAIVDGVGECVDRSR
ncbi:MAG: L-seryl-tRNA(Sec) selenium transferase [Gemmatimonadetes bacterium]|nr:L-seryl-tRNA(Sec) selenium transferase [Gemmatimonadota bacterium]